MQLAESEVRDTVSSGAVRSQLIGCEAGEPVAKIERPWLPLSVNLIGTDEPGSPFQIGQSWIEAELALRALAALEQRVGDTTAALSADESAARIFERLGVDQAAIR
jgi:hypothetical protein